MSPSSAPLSSSSMAARLKNTSRNIPTEILGESLLRVMESSEDRDGVSFLQLIIEDAKSVAKERAALRHCVRCHTNYYLKRNNNEACQIPHVFDAENPMQVPVKNRWGEREYEYRAKCCHGTTLIEENEFEYRLESTEPRYCFSGRHTTDIRDVKYHRYSILKCKKKDGVGKCLRQPRGPMNEPIFTDSPEYPDSDGVAEDGFQAEYTPDGFDDDDDDESGGEGDEDDGDEDEEDQGNELDEDMEVNVIGIGNGYPKRHREEEIDELDEEVTKAQIVVERRRRRK